MAIPSELRGQKYISLVTFRKNGAAIPTPIWFAETSARDTLYVMTRNDSGKYKRIRNNPQVRIAPCTMRGKVTGPEFAATAHILPAEDWAGARKSIREKYLAGAAALLEQTQRVPGNQLALIGTTVTVEIGLCLLRPLALCYHHLFPNHLRVQLSPTIARRIYVNKSRH